MKKLILLVAFALPVLIFIFLKMFGQNQFSVEPLFQSGAVLVDSECGRPASYLPADTQDQGYRTPYVVPREVLKSLGWNSSDSLTLYAMGQVNNQVTLAFKRLSEKYTPEELRLWQITTDTTNLWENNVVRNVVTLDQLSHCFFLMPDGTNTVMVDGKGRIRGQYTIDDRKDFDRLVVETRIILKK
jgi:hypothetical protein